MVSLNGKKALVTTKDWFYGPDGEQYRAAWGTVTIRRALYRQYTGRECADWLADVGGALTIDGRQITHALLCEDMPIGKDVLILAD
jgi:hypothetical protein